MTIDDFQQLGLFFDKLINSPSIRWSIIAAGAGAVVETLHIFWLAARYLFKF
jgi:hypothetical protein